MERLLYLGKQFLRSINLPLHKEASLPIFLMNCSGKSGSVMAVIPCNNIIGQNEGPYGNWMIMTFSSFGIKNRKNSHKPPVIVIKSQPSLDLNKIMLYDPHK